MAVVRKIKINLMGTILQEPVHLILVLEIITVAVILRKVIIRQPKILVTLADLMKQVERVTPTAVAVLLIVQVVPPQAVQGLVDLVVMGQQIITRHKLPKKKSDAVGGTTNAIKGGSGGSNGKSSTNSKNGGRPSILASSDLVGFQFNEGEINRGTKVNAGYTSVRYDGLRSHGFMVDYTSAIQGGNITGYYAWINPKAITLLANTVTVGFSGSGSLYNTVAFGQMRNIKKFKAVYMLTASGGQIYRQSYYGSAAIVGGNRDFKLGKRIDVKTMMLFVYAPFVRYYDDAVLKSPYVILPIVGVNLGVTKTFKLNFNFGGAYSIGDNVLNYTLMMGTRLAI